MTDTELRDKLAQEHTIYGFHPSSYSFKAGWNAARAAETKLDVNGIITDRDAARTKLTEAEALIERLAKITTQNEYPSRLNNLIIDARTAVAEWRKGKG